MVGGRVSHPCWPSASAQVKAFVDKNVLVRHLTGDPPDQAGAATRFLQVAEKLYLPDLVLAEVIYVLESYYRVERAEVATFARAVVAFPSIVVIDDALLFRAIELYDVERLDFAEAYLVACAEISEVNAIATFDRSVDRVPTVTRIEPR